MFLLHPSSVICFFRSHANLAQVSSWKTLAFYWEERDRLINFSRVEKLNFIDMHGALHIVFLWIVFLSSVLFAFICVLLQCFFCSSAKVQLCNFVCCAKVQSCVLQKECNWPRCNMQIQPVNNILNVDDDNDYIMLMMMVSKVQSSNTRHTMLQKGDRCMHSGWWHKCISQLTTIGFVKN